MALPPRGDPRRPLHLAIRSTRVLAILFLLFGTCAFIPMLMQGGMPRRGGLFLGVSDLLFYIGPGAAYLVFSLFLRQRQFWAVVAALVLASIQLILTLFFAGALLIATLRQPNSSISLIAGGMVALVILALGQLIYHLALSFEAIKYGSVEQQHGFEPLMVQPVDLPAPPGDSKGPPTIR